MHLLDINLVSTVDLGRLLSELWYPGCVPAWAKLLNGLQTGAEYFLLHLLLLKGGSSVSAAALEGPLQASCSCRDCCKAFSLFARYSDSLVLAKVTPQSTAVILSL